MTSDPLNSVGHETFGRTLHYNDICKQYRAAGWGNLVTADSVKLRTIHSQASRAVTVPLTVT
jgi:hypothetical protein